LDTSRARVAFFPSIQTHSLLEEFVCVESKLGGIIFVITAVNAATAATAVDSNFFIELHP
jgi:hypothetical protein